MKLHLTLIALTVFSASALSQSSEAIRKYTESISAGVPTEVQGQLIHSTTLLPEFYFENQFQRVWTRPLQASFLGLVKRAYEHGLNPADYHFSGISTLHADAVESQSTDAEILFTDAFLLYASHFLNGKLNPEEVEGEWQAVRREGNAKSFLKKCLASGNIEAHFKELEPENVSYHGLLEALKKYREIQKNGGWDLLEAGETLKPQMAGARVTALKHRLSIEGYFLMEGDPNDMYTQDLSEAVREFQKHHGLEVDGNVGKQTLASLNIPVSSKIAQIRANMERLRWISQDMGDHYVFVNIADFTMKVYRGDTLSYQQNVVVGKPFRKTPVFSDLMTYFVLNPYWTVPPTILFNDVLPEVKKDINYLKVKNMKVLKGSEVVDPQTIDWSKLSRSNFPYTIRQDPGPTNALGAVKFMFPNKYNIYIHDTPSKELFNRPDRAFSSGCIRLNKPMGFVDYLITDIPDWNSEKVDNTLKTGKDKTVMLKRPINVHILYLTAWADDSGVQFRNDVYQRDAAVIEALAESAPTME
ncbi:MAG: L,D-transpeptidase family protein [Roseivirga sp.]|jgi:murein L,D-transpeptidase YcbB/YkuD|uniref:L,D-transpeptidase family protein n=1 Tax=Roseivirga sp. TaxID=1964215 RepID=UPI001AFCEC3A|nr:L,D-transpeptidase family protein [Roseivirga sp.]MBO6494958.1 L,D-transpeptidase family protein [Roseivirga sp.]